MNNYYREYCLTTPSKQDKCENTPQKNAANYIQMISLYY